VPLALYRGRKLNEELPGEVVLAWPARVPLSRDIEAANPPSLLNLSREAVGPCFRVSTQAFSKLYKTMQSINANDLNASLEATECGRVRKHVAESAVNLSFLSASTKVGSLQ
jgi:hypothetical protein